MFIEPESCVQILKNQRVFDRGKEELENAKGREHESIFAFKTAFLECFQTDLLPQTEQSVILLTRERCRTVSISSRHHMYSIKVEKLLVFYFLQHEEFFPENSQNESNGGCS